MADSIDFKVFAGPFQRMVADKQKRMPRASMWAVREAGRVTQRAARAKAPVLRQKGALTHGQIQRGRRIGVFTAEDIKGIYGTGQKGEWGSPVPGLLRASIKSSRGLRMSSGAVSVRVAPRGARVRFYSVAEEGRAHYMRAGEMAAKAAMPGIARSAYQKVWAT